MVLRKDRPPPGVTHSTHKMSNEQPVTKRQRIENNGPTTTTSIIDSDTSHLSSPHISPTTSANTSLIINGNSLNGADELDHIATATASITDIHTELPPSTDTGAIVLTKSSTPASDSLVFQDYLVKQCLCGISDRTLAQPFQGHYNQNSSGGQRVVPLTEWPTNKLVQFLSNLQLLLDVYLKQNTTGNICQRIMDICNTLIQNGQHLIDEIIDLCDYNNKYVQFLSGKVMASFLVVAKDQMNNDWLEKLVNILFMFEEMNFDAVRKISFSLDIFKRIIEWKDVDLHPLDDSYLDEGADNLPLIPPPIENNYFAAHLMDEYGGGPSFGATTASISCETNDNVRSSRPVRTGAQGSPPPLPLPQANGSNENDDIEATSTECQLAPTLRDSESFDTTCLKLETVKMLENKWPALVRNMSILITCYRELECGESTILTFLTLWESIISVQANLSVVQTLPFHAQLNTFELLLSRQLSSTVYKQMLTLFNEALCYGSTLALQDGVPQEARMLANQIVRHVRDVRNNPPISFPILQTIPQRQPENVVSLIGYSRPTVQYESGSFDRQQNDVDSDNVPPEQMPYVNKTLLQKMVLLILKSVAVTVKEVRGDSSDSSIDSSDNQAIQDMVHIESSIRDAMEKLETFIKNTLEFHPESHFSKILIHLFDDQDDYLIEAMVCTLDVTSILSFRHNPFPELVAMLNPVYTFLEFLKMISNSSDLLLDLLVSNETCFLLYLLRFLKYVRLNWSMFAASCRHSEIGGNALDDAMAVLIRLRLQISRLVSRSLYPYDISPVLRLLESCESLYEGNELS